MPGLRAEMMQWTDTMLDFGRVVGSRLSATVKNVLCDVVGIEMEEGGAERRDSRPLYGHAGVLVRPAAPTDAGSFEVIFARVGDDMIPLASRDVRWQVDLEEGEVVVRSMSDTPARIYLKPDGSVVVEAASIKLGSADANRPPSMADASNELFDKIAAALDAFCTASPTLNDGGAALQTATKAVWGADPKPPADTGSTVVKIDG